MALIDPNGMDIIPVKGGLRFTEEDAKSALNVLSGKAKNVYMAIEGKTNRRNNINRAQSGYGNAQWAVFVQRILKWQAKL